MVKVRKTTQELMKIKIEVRQVDIDNGVPCKASLCMHKVAINRALDELEHGSHKVRVDAGTIKFNIDGHRWEAKTPKVARRSLIMFDNKKTRGNVKPHEYTVTAVKGSKIVKVTAERQEEINAARRQRIAAGGNERRRNYSLHDRVVGFDLGHGG